MKVLFRRWLIILCSLGALISFVGVPAQAFAAVSPSYVPCTAGYVYDNVSSISYPLVQIGPTYGVKNGTSSAITATLTATVTGTVTLTTNASATVKAGVIMAGVEATVGVSLSASITTSVAVSSG